MLETGSQQKPAASARSSTAPRQALFRAQAAHQAAQSTTARTQPAPGPAPAAAPMQEERYRVLHVGCGANSANRLHRVFGPAHWDEIRLDIDDSTKPDISGSIVDMRGFAEDECCDAIYASHVVEHMLQHEIASALSEFHRVLTPTGFALIRVPDIEAVAQFIIDGRIDEVIYTSPAGPVTPLDMLYGHGGSIARGSLAMRHGTAFTQDLMAKRLLTAGFAELRVTRTDTYEIWAAAFMPEADIPKILADLAEAGTDLHE
jgi:SAM-dependent methyltransferase